MALLELLERQPLEAITIREITDAAGVGYATFYRHYATKAALLDGKREFPRTYAGGRTFGMRCPLTGGGHL